MNWEKFKYHFHVSWWPHLKPFIESEECNEIYKFLRTRTNITPASCDTYKAFEYCMFSKLRVVVMGVDPYTEEGVADGLAFSSRYTDPYKTPKTLDTLLTAIEQDCYEGLNLYMNSLPDLDEWCRDGILLLNYNMTTEVANPKAHNGKWESFHKYLIEVLNREKSNLVYILLGEESHHLERFIDTDDNLVLKTEHPEEAVLQHRQMKHGNVFSQANEYLNAYNLGTVDWARTLPF